MMWCWAEVRTTVCMESLHNAASHAVRRLLAGQPTTPAKIAFAWKIAAGQAMSRATETALSADGVLVVRARTEAWHREVRVARALLLRRLQDLLGPGVIARLKIED